MLTLWEQLWGHSPSHHPRTHPLVLMRVLLSMGAETMGDIWVKSVPAWLLTWPVYSHLKPQTYLAKLKEEARKLLSWARWISSGH